MKLGTETGSLVNHIMTSAAKAVEPEVGKGATVYGWTDRHAYEVIEVSKDKKTVIIQQYLPERIDTNGMSECQDYKFEKLSPYKETVVFKWGGWRKVGKPIEFNKDYYKSFEDACLKAKEELKEKYNYKELWKKYIGDLFDDNANLILVEGKTIQKTVYSKINIRFGVKDEYYDFSF